jgi:hypothetical protein
MPKAPTTPAPNKSSPCRNTSAADQRLSSPYFCTYAAIQPYETIDSAGKITILGSGKATTRVKRRITAAFEGTDLHSASPRGQQVETVLLP